MRVLNLGAGVQSTTLYLMEREGLVAFDCAIFADTGEEPAPVYRHLEWMQSLGGKPIMVRSLGPRLGDQLLSGLNGSGQRFVSIPAYNAIKEGKRDGITRRQCTKEYKIDVIERCIRRELFGLKPRQRMPKGTPVIQIVGLSFDEMARAARVKAGWRKGCKWSEPEFPLIDMGYSRRKCKDWLRDRVPHEVPRSACTFCPFRSTAEWRWLIENDPEGFSRACDIDDALRIPGNVLNRKMDRSLYVLSSCRPLREATFDEPETLPGFTGECLGMCGS